MEELGVIERGAGDMVTLRFRRAYPATLAELWSALTAPAKLQLWLAKARVSPRAGGEFALFVDRPRPTLGSVVEWSPTSRLAFTWNTGDAPESVVRCDLATTPLGVSLGFAQGEVAHRWIALMLPGWHVHLERLERLLAGRPLAFSEERWRSLQARYIQHYRLTGVETERQPGHDIPRDPGLGERTHDTGR